MSTIKRNSLVFPVFPPPARPSTSAGDRCTSLSGGSSSNTITITTTGRPLSKGRGISHPSHVSRSFCFREEANESLDLVQMRHDWQCLQSALTTVEQQRNKTGNTDNDLLSILTRWSQGITSIVKSIDTQSEEYQQQQKKKQTTTQHGRPATANHTSSKASYILTADSLSNAIPSLSSFSLVTSPPPHSVNDEHWRLSIQSENDQLRRRNGELQRRLADTEEDVEQLLTQSSSPSCSVSLPGFSIAEREAKKATRMKRNMALEKMEEVERNNNRLKEDIETHKHEQQKNKQKMREMQETINNISVKQQMLITAIDNNSEEWWTMNGGGSNNTLDSSRSINSIRAQQQEQQQQRALSHSLQQQLAEANRLSTSQSDTINRLQEQINMMQREHDALKQQYKHQHIQHTLSVAAYSMINQKNLATQARQAAQITAFVRQDQQRRENHQHTQDVLEMDRVLQRRREEQLMDTLHQERQTVVQLQHALKSALQEKEELRVIARKEQAAMIKALTPMFDTSNCISSVIPNHSDTKQQNKILEYEEKQLFHFSELNRSVDSGPGLLRDQELLVLSGVGDYLLSQEWAELRAHKGQIRTAATHLLKTMQGLLEQADDTAGTEQHSEGVDQPAEQTAR